MIKNPLDTVKSIDSVIFTSFSLTDWIKLVYNWNEASGGDKWTLVIEVIVSS